MPAILCSAAIAILTATQSYAFSIGDVASCRLAAAAASSSWAPSIENNDRRTFLSKGLMTLTAGMAVASGPAPASARVFLDPAMYGDQELRVSAVDSLRESVRRALIQKPSLTPHFLELALLDSLSFNLQTNEGGPDGSIIKAVVSSKGADEHTKALQECASVLIDAKRNLKNYQVSPSLTPWRWRGPRRLTLWGAPYFPLSWDGQTRRRRRQCRRACLH